MYLETMERVLGGTEKVIVDTKQGTQGVVPYLPLQELAPPAQKGGQPSATGGQQ
jgi:membrane protease subunit HflK